MIDAETPYELDIAWTLGRIEWLLRMAELVYDQFGADDMDKWDLNGPLLLAIQTAHADLTSRRLEQDPRCIGAPADERTADLANAIAIRLGEESRATWDSEQLVALATKVVRP